MWQLCVPWILAILIGIIFFLLFFIRFRCLLLGLLILAVFLNWKYEVVTLNCFSENKSERTFKVMTWNIDGSSPTILDNISKIGEKIIKENADVVFIAEDYYECCDSLDALLKSTYPYSTHVVCNDSHYFYSKYPLNKSKWIGMEIDSISSIIQCNVMIDGHRINLLGCHLSSNNYSSNNQSLRPNQISDIFDFWKYIKNVEAAVELRKLEAKLIVDSLHMECPTIILGDMNDVSGSPALRTFENVGFKNAWWQRGCGYGATILYPLPFRIDHILWRDAMYDEGVKDNARKLLKLKNIRNMKAEGLSDHNALVAEYEYN